MLTYVIYAIMGFCLGLYLGKMCKIKYEALDSNMVRKKIFKYKGKNYRFVPVPVLSLN